MMARENEWIKRQSRSLTSSLTQRLVAANEHGNKNNYNRRRMEQSVVFVQAAVRIVYAYKQSLPVLFEYYDN